MELKNFIRNKRLQLIFTILGATGGFLYWKYVGCLSGTCPIQSVWYLTVMWGTIMGYLVGDLIFDILKKHKNKGGAQ